MSRKGSQRGPAPLTRREVLKLLAAAAASGCGGSKGEANPTCADGLGIRDANAPGPLADPVALDADPFTLGVASGDPLSDRVILWTRLAPDPLAGGGMANAAVPVRWEIGDDPEMRTVLGEGETIARPEDAHSVHVDVAGLEGDRHYWYRFRAGEFVSPIGRTRTAPCAGTAPASMRFAVASCQNYRAGFYSAYRHLAEEAIDVVFFLGDYIYESGVGDLDRHVRLHNSDTLRSLEDYRNRYALYKRDEHLRAAHAAHPWVVTWDDHEVGNDYAGLIDGAYPDESPETFRQRVADAYRAWWEHQPVRVAPPRGTELEIFRGFSWGDLVDFWVVDTRQYRDRHVCGEPDDDVVPVCDERDAPERTMLGSTQRAWLFDGLRASSARWKLLVNQVLMTTADFGGSFHNSDVWDGYTAERQALLDAVREGGLQDFHVLTGDIHTAGVGRLTTDASDPESPLLATELITTSITSGGDEDPTSGAARFIEGLPQVDYFEPLFRGYLRCDLSFDRLRADFRLLDSVTVEDAPMRTRRSFQIDSGNPEAKPLPSP